MALENERVVYNPLAIGGNPGMGTGFGFGSGGILEAILLASLFGNRRGFFGGDEAGGGRGEILAGDIAAKVVELQNTSDLKGDINGVKSAVIHDLQEVQADLQREINEAGKESLKAMFESKIAALQATNEITNKVGNETQALQGHINAFQVSTDKQFCHVDQKIAASTQAILNKISQDELDRKTDEINQLRDERNRLSQTLLFSNQMNSFSNQLNDMNQKLTNQTIQFGTGNVATPTATNNQVR